MKGGASIISNRNSKVSNSYIVTNGTGTVNIENLNSARGTVTLPIGTETNYNPVSIANTGTSDNYSVRVSDGISNTSNGAVDSTLDISEAVSGGSSVNLTLGWIQSQENYSFTRTSAKVDHYNGTIWEELTSAAVSGNNPYTISASGITVFSPFSVMNFSAMATNDFTKSKVSVCPNPCNDNLNISSNENGFVYFYDTSGKLVSTSMLMKGSNSLNKSLLEKGVYIYQVKGNAGNVISSGKVIKK